MNRSHWQDRTEHPAADVLLLHLEGELDRRDADSVSAHVASCHECRATCEQLGRGMSRFTALRDQAVIPPPVQQRSLFYERLRAAQADPAFLPLTARLLNYLRPALQLRAAFILSGIALALIISVIFYLKSPGQAVY